jgi:dGTP triphosphohydrolase
VKIIYTLFFYILLSLIFSSSQFAEGEDKEILKNGQPLITKVPLQFETFAKEEEEEEINSEIEFQKKRCKSDSIKNLSEVLAQFSKVDSLLALKSCVRNEKGLENRIKQQIFFLAKFPKLEILFKEKEEPIFSDLMQKLLLLWEERVYFYSNFYHGQSLLWLGEEKEISEEINRILYTDMSEKRKVSLLKKIIDDLETTNHRIYHLFQFSHKNLFLAKTLEEENLKSREILQSLLTILAEDEFISNENKRKLKSFNICLNNIDIKNPETRLAVFVGFWQDYHFLGNIHKDVLQKEIRSIINFLKKNILQSHHFERRLEKGLNVCELLPQSK